MYVVLLSGGSGKRLWPLSNDLRSKQYIRLLTGEQNTIPCSMVQRVWGQLQAADLDKQAVICASAGQTEMIRSQLGNVHIAIEPDRRNTFPAVALSCSYLKSHLGATEDDVVCILPVDPFTEASYFSALRVLEALIQSGKARIALMGSKPYEATGKYGYIVPDTMHEGYMSVQGFKEKPDTATAQVLIGKGALWNCGVFCMKIGEITGRMSGYGLSDDYETVFNGYNNLPAISFDHEVLEKTDKLAAVPFDGMWKDLGTWDMLTQEMLESSIGHVIHQDCINTHVINELNIPVVALGLNNTVVVASFDGILVAAKTSCPEVKSATADLVQMPMYEERRWGILKTIDISEKEGKKTITRKIRIFDGMSSSYHFHNARDEVWTVLSGSATLLLEGLTLELQAGSTICIRRGQKHAVKAHKDFEYMEIHMGEQVGNQDINRITFDWDMIPRA